MQARDIPPRLKIEPLDVNVSLRGLAYEAIKRAITDMDIYAHPEEIRLDERQLSEELGVSRTPIREAMTLLEQEGFVRSIPRRGNFVVRKTKSEVVDMIIVWAALESMSARLAAARATNDELRGLKKLFEDFEKEKPADHLSEYSEANMTFHQTIMRLGRCRAIIDMTENLFLHMRAIRSLTMRQENRAEKSMRAHMGIIAALERRDAEEAERLVRDHTLDLAAHVEKHADF